jgi:NAD kinase
VKKGSNVGLFVDGKYIATLQEGEEFKVEKCPTATVFLRKSSYDFFKRLREKLKERGQIQ